MTHDKHPNTLARALRRFFADHMPLVRGLSPHTVRSYRDAFALLLRFLARRQRRDVVDLDLVDLDPDSVIAFLDELERAAPIARRRATPASPLSTPSPALSPRNTRSTSKPANASSPCPPSGHPRASSSTSRPTRSKRWSTH